jgi:hypothetical protein
MMNAVTSGTGTFLEHWRDPSFGANEMIRFTVWSSDFFPNHVIFFRGLKVDNFGRRQYSMGSTQGKR